MLACTVHHRSTWRSSWQSDLARAGNGVGDESSFGKIGALDFIHFGNSPVSQMSFAGPRQRQNFG